MRRSIAGSISRGPGLDFGPVSLHELCNGRNKPGRHQPASMKVYIWCFATWLCGRFQVSSFPLRCRGQRGHKLDVLVLFDGTLYDSCGLMLF